MILSSSYAVHIFQLIPYARAWYAYGDFKKKKKET
jgi:hypothetical protein